ncbi:MAG: WbqC family protein [Lachnospiraceae bacterium]|nr:WbqC family protein [Lachnospiraceae bacterium]
MKIGIMQPYFFPYLGYWQLMNMVDVYVVYVDGLFRPHGWINRNRILIGDTPHYITIPVHGSEKTRIRDITIPDNGIYFKKKIVRSIEENYGKADYFDECNQLIKDAILLDENRLSDYLMKGIENIREYLEITTPLIISSSIPMDQNASAQEKIFQICSYLGGNHYINAIGGLDLYNKDQFSKKGLKLSFLKMNDFEYKQHSCEFYSGLSIIDVIMNNSRKSVKEMLEEFTLI